MSKPSPPNSFVRHVVDRTGPYSKITDKARKELLQKLVKEDNTPSIKSLPDSPGKTRLLEKYKKVKTYLKWHLNNDYPESSDTKLVNTQSGGKRRKRRKSHRRKRTRKRSKSRKKSRRRRKR
jgi:hypothetical protein